jgi:hypothetical protein
MRKVVTWMVGDGMIYINPRSLSLVPTDSGAPLQSVLTSLAVQIPLKDITTTTYQLSTADAGHILTFNNALPVSVTVPPSSTAKFENGVVIDLIQSGTGKATVCAGPGVTINSKEGKKSICAQYVAVTLIKADSLDTWFLIGDLIT